MRDVWQEIYENGLQLNIFPFTDLINLHKKFLDQCPQRPVHKVLELGCGTANNYSYFKTFEKSIDYYGIEQSSAAVEFAISRFPELKQKIAIGDFTDIPPEKFQRDLSLIIDRAALTHNNSDSIQKVLDLMFDSLLPGGLFLGIDWFSE